MQEHRKYKKSYEKDQAIPDSLKKYQQTQVTQGSNVLGIFSNSLKNINLSFKNVEYIINRTDKDIKSSTSDLLGSGRRKLLKGGTLTAAQQAAKNEQDILTAAQQAAKNEQDILTHKKRLMLEFNGKGTQGRKPDYGEEEALGEIYEENLARDMEEGNELSEKQEELLNFLNEKPCRK